MPGCQEVQIYLSLFVASGNNVRAQTEITARDVSVSEINLPSRCLDARTDRIKECVQSDIYDESNV